MIQNIGNMKKYTSNIKNIGCCKYKISTSNSWHKVFVSVIPWNLSNKRLKLATVILFKWVVVNFDFFCLCGSHKILWFCFYGMPRYIALYFSEFETILLKQEVIWACIGRSEEIKEHLNDFWMSCVRSGYVVCPEGMIFKGYYPTNLPIHSEAIAYRRSCIPLYCEKCFGTAFL